EVEPRGDKERRRKRRSRRPRGGLAQRALRRILLLIVAVALLPFALSFLYKIPAVHPVSTLMLRDLILLSGYDRRWTALDELGPSIVNAVMMSEDARFCEHGGIDWDALRPVIADALSGEETRGA